MSCRVRIVNDAERPFERAEVALERVVPAADELEEIRHRFRHPAGERVLNGLADQPLLPEPAAGDLVQARHLAVKAAARSLLQKLGEQPMVAVPEALPVEALHKQVPALEFLQSHPGIAGFAEPVGKIAVDPFEDRGLHQEGLQRWFKIVKHLLKKVIGEIRIAPGELLQHLERRRSLRQPAMHGVQRDRPTFRAGL